MQYKENSFEIFDTIATEFQRFFEFFLSLVSFSGMYSIQIFLFKVSWINSFSVGLHYQCNIHLRSFASVFLLNSF